MNFGDDDDVVDTSVEDSILDEVEALTGTSFDDDEEIQEPQPEEVPEQETSNQQAAPEAQRPRADNQQQRGVNPEVQRWINARRHTDYDYNDRGDLVDKKTGKVVYEKGTPAREFFSALKNEQFERSKVIGQAQQLYSAYEQQGKQLEQYQNAFKVASDSGLAIQDQALAMEHMAAYKANPVQALRKMLHTYQVEGGDLTDIFDDLPKIQLEGVEARLKAMADRIEAPEREKQSTNEMMQNLNREVQSFFGENPEAEMHSDTLAYIINSAAQKNQRVSLSQAWTRLLRFCNSNGLRIDQPLKDQLSSGQQQEAPPVQQRRQTPMPQRGRSNGIVPRQQNSKPSYEKRNRDIVEEAMAEAGFLDS
jgi:hypothetical protein